MKAKTILLITISSLLFWFGIIGLFFPYEFSFLTHKQNTLLQAVCIVIGVIFLIFSMWSHYQFIYKKYREYKFIKDLYGKEIDKLKERIGLDTQRMNAYKASQSDLMIRCKESEQKHISWKGNYTKLSNKLKRKENELKELNKKYASLNISYSILKDKQETLNQSKKKIV